MCPRASRPLHDVARRTIPCSSASNCSLRGRAVEDSEMAEEGGPITVGDLSNRRVVWVRVVAIGLLLAGVVSLVFYVSHYQSEWEARRKGWKVETNHGPYMKVRAAFLADLDAERLDSAYAATTSRYRMN